MDTASLELCLAFAHAHARLTAALDEVLGTWHGVGFAEFQLLHAVAGAPGGRCTAAALAGRVGRPRSPVLRDLLRLEKIGLVVRERSGAVPSQVRLGPGGARVLSEATQTAAAAAVDVWAWLQPASRALLADTFAEVCAPAPARATP